MGSKTKKKWIIKDRSAKVKGPFETDRILRMIETGEIIGNESIALYPSTDWQPISRDPQFYDKLLELLEGESSSEGSEQPHSGADEILGGNIVDDPDEFVEKSSSQSQSKKSEKPHNRAYRVGEDGKEEVREKEKIKKKEKAKMPEEPPPDIELKKRKEVVKKVKQKKMALPMVLAVGAVLGALALIFFDEVQVKEDRVRLIIPQLEQSPQSDEVTIARVQTGVVEYLKDTRSGYILAQNNFVQAFEGDNRNAGAIALLCMTYFELWPFAYQDSRDYEALTFATQYASRIDPASIEAATCRTVDLMSRGRYVEARSLVETMLEGVGRSADPSASFYYYRALLLKRDGELNAALSYAKSAQQLWPQWLRAYVLEASIQERLENYPAAVKRYQEILQVNPNHVISKILLGVLEYKHLRNYERGKELLRGALATQEIAPNPIMSRGFLGLSEIALHEGNSSEALRYAQRAYSLNSTNTRSREIILSLGGEEKLRQTRILDRQLVYEGDQFVRDGDCRAAQAHYKSAYEVNNKNGVAAMKAAECLWELGLSTEAISWLNRAITADMYLMDAYVLLADYYTRRFDFIAAGQILAKARSLQPESYKVFRGYALVELRRQNSPGSIDFANRAIQLYSADVESYIILARAHILARDFSKAFPAATKAIEIDVNHRQAQAVYAEALAGVRGVSSGVDYMSRLVRTYPLISDYRMALGRLHMTYENYTRAEEVFQQVVRMDSKPKEALIQLGLSRQRQRKFDGALRAYLEAAALDPSDGEPLFRAGQLYLDAKKPVEARQQFQRVLQVNPNYPRVHYSIGRAALEMQSPQEALEQAVQEKNRNPNLADPYVLAAEAYEQLRQYNLCASEYQQAIRLRPHVADYYIRIASCNRMSGNLDAAAHMIATAKDIESGNPEVWKEQGAIFETQGNAIFAIEAYNQYLALRPNAADRSEIERRIQNLGGG